MGVTAKDFWGKFFNLLPLLILFFISLNGSSVINIKFFSINIHYILVYYWVLRKPDSLGYGFIFLSGIISDVVFGLPIGINALSLLVIAAVAAYVLWVVLSKLLDEKAPVSEENKKKWRVAQWIATCLLWHQWLAHDIANVAVFLPRGEALPLWMFISFVVILVIGLSLLFYNRGGKIQEIVIEKSSTSYVRSATIIDAVYAFILLYLKQMNNIPMSTTWVFVGLLCGRELAIATRMDRKVKKVFPLLAKDFMKMMLGLCVSIVIVLLVQGVS